MIAIIGKGGSGKDYAMDLFKEHGYSVALKTTTRPRRVGEIENVNYNFIDNEQFLKLIEDGMMYFYQHFPQYDWYYGVTLKEASEKDVILITPGELSTLEPSQQEDLVKIYLNISDEVIAERLIKRDDQNDKAKDRIESDRIQFAGFDNYDIQITNPNFTFEEIEKQIMDHNQHWYSLLMSSFPFNKMFKRLF